MPWFDLKAAEWSTANLIVETLLEKGWELQAFEITPAKFLPAKRFDLQCNTSGCSERMERDYCQWLWKIKCKQGEFLFCLNRMEVVG
jgi:hypothetical protein